MTPYDLNFRHLASVAAVVKAGSVSEAAQLVHLTQPAISQAIAKLERQLAATLFVRQPDGMVPTDAGRIIGDRAAQALRLMGTSRVTSAQTRAFLAYVEMGTFSAASELTGLSKASLHRAILDLSGATGVRLLDRRGRALILTRRGTEIARSLALGVAEIQSALFELSALLGREQGRILIGAMPLSRARILPEAICAFHGRHPDIDLKIVEGSHSELVEPLRNGRIDLMIGALRSGEVPGLSSTKLFDDCPVIVARHGHPLAATTRSPTALEITQFPWIVPSEGTPLRRLWKRMFETIGLALPHVAIECGSAMTIRQLLIRTDYLTLLSADQVAAEIDASWLAIIGPAPGDLARTIGVTVREDWRPTKAQDMFLACLNAAAPGKPPGPA
ncbi:LysR family transcriptional regulator [Sphingopyxis sp. 22461]|uniref:LysR family transcriptional regulator n=1 Tax=Sphingopyxis sp. 22461 TaxID=3453923 RepID=UPI003F82D53C